MNTRLVAALAVAVAIAVGAVGYAIGISGQTGELTAEQHAQIEAMVAEALPAEPQADPIATEIASLNEGQRGEVEVLIRSHLIANPEIIADAITELQDRQTRAQQTAQIDAITENAEIIFASNRQVVLGNPEGDVTLVEFFDYNCTYCKRSLSDVAQLLEADPNLRVVLKEFPVLGEGSVEAARVSVAVSMIAPEKYKEFHFALLSEPGEINGERALAMAEELGVDVDQLVPLLESDDVNSTINEVYDIAGLLNLTGTPTFVTRREVVVGAVGYDELRSRIAEIRAN